MNPEHRLWLRAEAKPFEQRCAIISRDAKALVQAGLTVVVEVSTQGCFSAEDYPIVLAAGLYVVSSTRGCIVIIGIKELPVDSTALLHRHVFIMHV